MDLVNMFEDQYGFFDKAAQRLGGGFVGSMSPSKSPGGRRSPVKKVNSGQI